MLRKEKIYIRIVKTAKIKLRRLDECQASAKHCLNNNYQYKALKERSVGSPFNHQRSYKLE